jgi:hypothetical protein
MPWKTERLWLEEQRTLRLDLASQPPDPTTLKGLCKSCLGVHTARACGYSPQDATRVKAARMKAWTQRPGPIRDKVMKEILDKLLAP